MGEGGVMQGDKRLFIRKGSGEREGRGGVWEFVLLLRLSLLLLLLVLAAF